MSIVFYNYSKFDSSFGADIEWDDRQYINLVKAELNKIIEYGAVMTEEDAKRNLERMAPDSTGTLASQIAVRASEYEDGGWIIEAQGKGNYGIVRMKNPYHRKHGHSSTGFRKTNAWRKWRNRFYASFVELGTSKMQGLGYLRKALRRNKYRMRARLRQTFGEVR